MASSAPRVLLLVAVSTLVWPALRVFETPSLAQGGASRPAGWNDATHGSDVAPDYARLFSMDRVHELRITISAENYSAIQKDLQTLGPAIPGLPPGGGRGAPPAGGPGAPGGPGGLFALPPAFSGPQGFQKLMEASGAACAGKTAGTACTVEGMPPAESTCVAMFGGPLSCTPKMFADLMQGGAPPDLISRDPIYVPVSVQHDGRTWTGVGMRYKGNSSLMAGSMSGNGKIPFRLDFDRYEDDVPGIRNQRFYGFGELTFSSNFSDDSQVREVLASEIFRDRGVPAPRAAFYRIVVDRGAGAEYWGLYSVVEDPSDGAMLDAQFGGRRGNLYKPDGAGADWTKFVQDGFPKKTNERRADYSDVSEAIRALHVTGGDPKAWRSGLEAAFDVDLFLRWLAVNTVIDNWDVYGALAHNYYLYGDPAQKGRLRWIPWDNNMAFGVGPGFGPPRGGGPGPGGPPFPPGPPGARGGGAGGVPGAGPRGGGAQPPPPMGFGVVGGDVLHRQVSDRWPLIQRLLADEVYGARYRELLQHATEGLAAPQAFEQRARALHALVAPAVVGPQGERSTHTTISSAAGFEAAVSGPGGLLEQMTRRREAVRTALGAPRR